MALLYFLYMLTFSIGSLNFLIEGNIPNEAYLALDPWVNTIPSAHWTISVKTGDIPLIPPESLSQRGDFWYFENDYAHGFLCQLLFCSISIPDKTISMWPLQNESPLLALSEIIKHAVSIAALEAGGFLFHSSALYRPGYGACGFFGGSGVGKSTIHKLLQPSWLPLHDEFNVILRNSTTYSIYSTPLSGRGVFSDCKPYDAPLRRCFRLKKGVANNLDSLHKSEYTLVLAKEVVLLPSDNNQGALFLDTIASFTLAIPADDLTVAKNDRFEPWFSSLILGEAQPCI